MPQFSRALFTVFLITGAVLIAATTGRLPPQVASHFGAAGTPNGWMDRGAYLAFMLGFAVAMPLAVVLPLSVLSRRHVDRINLPHRDYWLAPPRREATLRYLGAHACLLGALLVALVVGVHFTLLEANAAQPPRLPGPLFGTLVALFPVAMAAWVLTLVLHFRRKG